MISDLDEEVIDWDWFSVDRQGEIAHFTTGGRGFMPRSATQSKADVKSLVHYFRSCATVQSEAVKSTILSKYVQFQGTADEEKYLADYRFMATRGLHSFDCMIDAPRPSGYFLVVRPGQPMNIAALPPQIQVLLERTAFGHCFADIHILHPGSIV